MKTLCILLPILFVLGCGSPDPVDEVREARRNYKLSIDPTVSGESYDISYEIDLQNLNSDAALRELTVDVQLLNENNDVIWNKRHELDTGGLGNYATKTYAFKDNVGQEVESQYASHRVVIAPDVEGDEWKKYTEFMRIVRE